MQHVDRIGKLEAAVLGVHRGLELEAREGASLALLVPSGVPGEVVVNDGVEVLLEVDPLAQALRGA